MLIELIFSSKRRWLVGIFPLDLPGASQAGARDPTPVKRDSLRSYCQCHKGDLELPEAKPQGKGSLEEMVPLLDHQHRVTPPTGRAGRALHRLAWLRATLSPNDEPDQRQTREGNRVPGLGHLSDVQAPASQRVRAP